MRTRCAEPVETSAFKGELQAVAAGSFRWPPIMDGVMKLSPVEFAALFDGIDWTRVQTIQGILKPTVASIRFARDQFATATITQSLPDDVEALACAGAGDMAERDAAVTERDTLLTQNDRLRHLLLKLTRMHFGARSERLPEEQLQLGLEALEQAIAKDEAEAEKQDPDAAQGQCGQAASQPWRAAGAPAAGRGGHCAPEDTACPCCRATMTVIGEDSIRAAGLRDPGAVPGDRDHGVRNLPAARATGTVVQAPAPARLIEGGIGRPRRWSRMCWWHNMPTICRCIANVALNICDKMLRTGLCCGGPRFSLRERLSAAVSAT